MLQTDEKFTSHRFSPTDKTARPRVMGLAPCGHRLRLGLGYGPRHINLVCTQCGHAMHVCDHTEPTTTSALMLRHRRLTDDVLALHELIATICGTDTKFLRDKDS